MRRIVRIGSARDQYSTRDELDDGIRDLGASVPRQSSWNPGSLRGNDEIGV